MKFTVKTHLFKKALESAYKAIDGIKNSDFPENVWIRKTNGAVRILATTGHQSVDISVPCLDLEEVEFQLLGTKSLVKAMKFFIGHYITFDCGNNGLVLSCGKKSLNQKILIDEFPNLFKTIEETKNEFNYDCKKLKERYNAIKYAVPTKKCSTPTLDGICFRGNDMAACDGFRLAINKDENLNISDSFIVSPTALKYVTEEMSGEIKVTTNKAYITFEKDNMIFMSSLVEGEYVDYSRFSPANFANTVSTNVSEFKECLGYFKTFKDSKKSDSVHWYANKLGIINSNGRFESEIDIDGDMKSEFAFDINFLEDAFSQFEGDVNVQMNTNVSPIVITSETDSNNIALVVPVKCKNPMFEA